MRAFHLRRGPSLATTATVITKPFRKDARIRGLLAALLAVAFFAQSLLPAGWMPSSTGALLQLCAASGPVFADVDAPQPPSGDTEHRADQACPFALAGLWAKTDFHAIGVFAAVASAPFQTARVESESGRGIDRGPPLGSRAPPQA